MKRGEIVRDKKTGEVIFDPRKAVGQDFMIVPPDGRVLVAKVERCTLTQCRDGFMKVSITADLISHTTVEGVLVESTALEFAPPPVKPKRRIEEA
jgi:hypothetical protein